MRPRLFGALWLACLCASCGGGGQEQEEARVLEAPSGVQLTSLLTGVRLSWEHSSAEDFKVLRRGPAEDDFAELCAGTEGRRAWVDESVLLGKDYAYTVVALGEGLVSEPSAEVSGRADKEPADWTLIYFISSDGDYGYDYWFNIEGLEAEGGSDDQVHVLVLYDGFAHGDSRYYRLGGSILNRESFEIPTAEEGEVNMGDAQAYRDFVDWLLPRYSARHYFVSFHDHGGGSVEPATASASGILIQNMLYDQSSSDSLDPDEQGQVIAYLAERAAQQVDLVESMTCLGQMMENTYAMAGHARYHLGAESLSYVSGTFPVSFLKEQPDADAEALALYLLDDHHQGMQRMDVPCHWSVIDLDRLQDFASSLGLFSLALQEYADDAQGPSHLRDLAGQAQNFQLQPGDRMSAYVDLRDWLEILAQSADLPAELRADAQRLVDEFDGGLVLANRIHNGVHPGLEVEANYDRARGLSIYHPNSRQPFYVQASDPPYAELSFCRATGWADYLQAMALEPPEGPCPPVENLSATLEEDGSVLVAWDYPAVEIQP